MFNALRFAWDRKMRAAFDVCDAQRISFVPLPVETYGGWHPVAIRHISRLGRELSRSPACASQDNASKHLFQRLSLSIQKGNASLFLRRSTDIHYPDMLGELQLVLFTSYFSVSSFCQNSHLCCAHSRTY